LQNVLLSLISRSCAWRQRETILTFLQLTPRVARKEDETNSSAKALVKVLGAGENIMLEHAQMLKEIAEESTTDKTTNILISH
jgi:hypothetical protein